MSQTSDSFSAPVDASMGYDRSDTKGRSVFVGLAVGVVAIVLTIVFLNELFVMTTEEVRQEQYANATNPVLSDTRARSERNLSTYEWLIRLPAQCVFPLSVR